MSALDLAISSTPPDPRGLALAHALISVHPGRIGTADLSDLLYLCDGLAWRRLGRPITTIEWRKGAGPSGGFAFSRILLDLRAITRAEQRAPECPNTGLVPLGPLDPDPLTAEERAIAVHVVKTYTTDDPWYPALAARGACDRSTPFRAALAKGERLAMEELRP